MTAAPAALRVLSIVAGLAVPGPAWALDWASLWWNDDQRAARHMQRQAYAEAARTFNDARWRAAALYRAGEYEAAADAWSALDDLQAHYNRGNALARAGDLAAAVEAYETVLDRAPEHEDARYNLELLRERLRNGGDGDETDPQQDDGRRPEHRGGGGRDESDDRTEARTDAGAPGRQERDEPATRPSDEGTADDGRTSTPSGDGAAGQRREPRSGGSNESRAEPTPRADGRRAGEPEPGRRSEAKSTEPAEQAAMEQWLRRIPDDPGGLLRRKFRLQYERRERGEDEVRAPW